jgi:transcriptional regulator with XRE-family HTH domain
MTVELATPGPEPDQDQEPPPVPPAAPLSVGAIVRDLRLALGWSQSRLAAELGAVSGRDSVTRELVSRWEHGKRRPGPFWLPHIAAALQTPVTALEQAERMERQPFLTETASAAMAPLIASDLISHGFAAALGARRTPEAWRARLAAYGRDYMTRGADEIRQRLAADFVVLQQQLDQPSMWDTAARLMTLYGKTFPGAAGARAVGWYRVAAAAADRGGSRATRAWVRGRAAIALGYEGVSPRVADMFADQALAIEDRPSPGQLSAVMGKAHAAAVRGDRRAALDWLAEGRRIFDVAGSDDGDPSDYAVPWWRMNVFTSLLGARLGDERLAAAAHDTAVAALPPGVPRFRTHLDLHRGLVLARAGDRAGGSAHARAALARLPPDRHSLTLRMLLAEIEQAPAVA